MNMRSLGKSQIMVSEVGLGCEHLQGKSADLIERVVKRAVDGGVNMMDVFMSEPDVRTNIGAALKGIRQNVVLQGHIGSIWENGQYKRSRDLQKNRLFFEDLLTRYRTDYMDVGMIHFVDDEADWDDVAQNGVLDYAESLKREGKIRLVGMSSHNPQTALKAVKTGKIDVLMFSINPAYDLLPENTDIDSLFKPATFQQQGLQGANHVRETLYRTCEQMGVGITVMKALGAGVLLNEKLSPFRAALTPVQCVSYALSRPAVTSVMAGCQTEAEVDAALAYAQADAAARDYAKVLGKTTVYSFSGQCMYCNHCHPCPSRIDIAQVNKYLDLASVSEEVPATVREHYLALDKHGSDCVACGVCMRRCPFKVNVIDRMEQAAKRFGK